MICGSEGNNMKRPIFIVGLPRSGSTLWLNIFAQNPDILRMGEMLFLTPWRKDFRYFLRKEIGDLSSDENVEKMADLIFSDQKIIGLTGSFWWNEMGRINDPHLKKVIQERIKESDRSIESIFKSIVEEVSAYKGYKRFCVKFPVYPNFLPRLRKWYPESKIVHIVRDPRAMAVSKMNDPGGTQMRLQRRPWMKFFYRQLMIIFVIIQYIWTSRLHSRFKTLPNYALFRYEDLLSEPEIVVKRLCEFTGTAFVPEMLSPKEGQASSITGRQESGFNRKAATHWRRFISPFWEKIITFFTRESMKRFGYDCERYPVFTNIEPVAK
jgi:hypothetical protein